MSRQRLDSGQRVAVFDLSSRADGYRNDEQLPYKERGREARLPCRCEIHQRRSNDHEYMHEQTFRSSETLRLLNSASCAHRMIQGTSKPKQVVGESVPSRAKKANRLAS